MDWKMNTVHCSILLKSQNPGLCVSCCWTCSWSFSFCVVPPALRKKDVVKEFSFLQFLPEWWFPNPTQQRCAKKIIAEHWSKGGNPCYFCRTCFTHADTLSQFLLHSSCQMQLLQTWPCTGTQRIMLVTLMPHLTLWEYFYPCSLDYFLPVYLIFSLWLLQQSNGIWATPRTVHSCSFSPGQCQGFDLPGQHLFFLNQYWFQEFYISKWGINSCWIRDTE